LVAVKIDQNLVIFQKFLGVCRWIPTLLRDLGTFPRLHPINPYCKIPGLTPGIIYNTASVFSTIGRCTQPTSDCIDLTNTDHWLCGSVSRPLTVTGFVSGAY